MQIRAEPNCKMIVDREKEAHAVMTCIHEAIKALTKTTKIDLMKKNEKMLWPEDFSGMPYFVLVGKDLEGKRIFVTPTDVFFVITASICRGEYPILATRALMMQRIVNFMTDCTNLGDFCSFTDPGRSVIRMAAIAFVKGNVDCVKNPLGFEMCFPYGRSLEITYKFSQDRSDLNITLTSPMVFLQHEPVSEELNKRQNRVFEKLRAYASKGGDVRPLTVTLNSFTVNKEQEGN